jgi:putative FmdB family regulatory protein
MPLYEYKCAACGRVSEIRHGFNENHDDPCPACGGVMRRIFSAAPIVFKGSGFYVTDSRKGGASTKPSSEPKESESKSAEAKSSEAESSQVKSSEAKSPQAKSSEAKTSESTGNAGKSAESAA